jgi:putative nucleotidyltransferase with HDIG domain
MREVEDGIEGVIHVAWLGLLGERPFRATVRWHRMSAEVAAGAGGFEAEIETVGALWAYGIGRSLLAEDLPQRWRHSTGVARRALGCRAVVGDSVGTLVSAALLHDVGYAPEVNVTGFHALDGARYLRQLGVDDEVVRLVAHHSHSRIEAGIRGLGDELAEFAAGDRLLTDALVYCDMTTDPAGQPIDIDSRLGEIVERAGEGSVVAEFVRHASPDLRAATSRFAALLRSSGA